jgi:hypothetical protein
MELCSLSPVFDGQVGGLAMSDADTIAAAAKAAFPAEPVPPKEALLNEHCQECIDVSNAFGVRAWTTVPLADIVGKETALLTATAWRYYLPTMISWCVRDPDALDVLPQFLVYQLEPPRPGLNDEWFVDRKGGFSKAQREVIVAYLDWYRTREEAEYADLEMEPPRNVYRALEYWLGTSGV